MSELASTVRRHKTEHDRQRKKKRRRSRRSKPLGTAETIRALRETKGDVPKAADMLGCNKASLWGYLRTDAVAKTALNEIRSEGKPANSRMHITPQEVERMKAAIYEAEGNVRKAARILDVNQNSLYSRIARRAVLRRALRESRPTETERKNRRPVVVADPCVCGHAREAHYGETRGEEDGGCLHAGCFDSFSERSDCPGYRPAESLRWAA